MDIGERLQLTSLEIPIHTRYAFTSGWNFRQGHTVQGSSLWNKLITFHLSWDSGKTPSSTRYNYSPNLGVLVRRYYFQVRGFKQCLDALKQGHGSVRKVNYRLFKDQST